MRNQMGGQQLWRSAVSLKSFGSNEQKFTDRRSGSDRALIPMLPLSDRFSWIFEEIGIIAQQRTRLSKIWLDNRCEFECCINKYYN
jgi:hypothetical protein